VPAYPVPAGSPARAPDRGPVTTGTVNFTGKPSGVPKSHAWPVYARRSAHSPRLPVHGPGVRLSGAPGPQRRRQGRGDHGAAAPGRPTKAELGRSRSGTSRRRQSRSIPDRDTAFVSSLFSRRRCAAAGGAGLAQRCRPAHQASAPGQRTRPARSRPRRGCGSRSPASRRPRAWSARRRSLRQAPRPAAGGCPCPPARQALAGGVNNTARQAGGAIGIAVFGVIAGTPGNAGRFAAGLHVLAVLAAALWAAAMAVTAHGVPSVSAGRNAAKEDDAT
jgi:hypothetical protein